jgi:hypothetical protein
MVFRRICEKYRKAVPQSDGHNELGRHDVWSDRAKPGAETLPYCSGTGQRDGLQDALGDNAELDMSMISSDLPAHLHFGIHRGPYLQDGASVDAGVAGREETSVPTWMRPDASWITGYVGRRRWADGAHGWVDPQQFIGERLEEARVSGTARR